MNLAQLDPVFICANWVEAALWWLIALVFAVQSVRLRGTARQLCFVAVPVFAAFGASDIVEAQTGAWWRPWWLFAWKAACVVAMIGLLVVHVRRGRGRKST